jgi:hypothetical protein
MIEKVYVVLSLVPSALFFWAQVIVPWAYPNLFERGLLVALYSLPLSACLTLAGAVLTFLMAVSRNNRRGAILCAIGTLLSSVPIALFFR